MRRWLCKVGLGLMAVSYGWAGGGPQNVLVVVNDNSRDSQEIGKYYSELHGVSELNICHIRTTTNYSITLTAFSNEIRGPVLGYIASSGLSNQIDYVVLSRDIPYRVYAGDYASNRHSGITSCMYYDFFSSSNAFAAGCLLEDGSQSEYYESEQSFSHAEWLGSNRYYLCSLLESFTVDEGLRLIDRALIGDSIRPSGTIYLLHTLDDRNIQWCQFENAAFMMSQIPATQSVAIVEANYVTGRSNVVGYSVGYYSVANVLNNNYQPGALGEHVTSYGGFLHESSGQMSILEWIQAGCVGSYGTVVEPCADTNKFPDPRLHYWYARGFNMGESFYMAVRNPYQGVVVGDPLYAPYAVRPQVSVSGVTNGQWVSGSVAFTVTGQAVSAKRPVHRIDLFLDDVFWTTLTNVTPSLSNRVTVSINQTDCTYWVAMSNSLYATASGLASAVNAANVGVTARACADRVELKQNMAGVSGAWICVEAIASAGGGGRQTVFAWSPQTNFQETFFCAHEQVTLKGSPASGDIVRVVITNLAGVVVTNQVTAVSESTPEQLLSSLALAVNANPDLQDSRGCEMKWLWRYYSGSIEVREGYLVARTNTWEGQNLHVNYKVIKQPGSTLSGPDFSDYFNDNSDVLSARATVFLSEGLTNLEAGYVFSTTNLADGPHTLRAVAYEGTAVRSQGHTVIPLVIDNHGASCSIVTPASFSYIDFGGSVTVSVDAAATTGHSITSVVLVMEGRMAQVLFSAPYEFEVNTTNYGTGVLGIQALAYEDTGRSVASEKCYVTVLIDSDGDSLPDRWEYRYFGNSTNAVASEDDDEDDSINSYEYWADTNPTDSMSRFEIQSINGDSDDGRISLVFSSSTNRSYRIHYRDLLLEPTNDWTILSSEYVRGSNPVTMMYDYWTNMSATNEHRYYKIQVKRP